MKLYNTLQGILLEHAGSYFAMDEPWNYLVNRNGLQTYLASKLDDARPVNAEEAAGWLAESSILAPIGSQEVWAAGVTYLKSRDARMEESQSSGGASLYDRVYDADRPELFFKATAGRVSGEGQLVYIRRDSSWNVPEPELTLFINSEGNIEGYTIGNDMSSRSIEGENALYLPQAKIYERSAALGPCLYVSETPIAGDAVIKMTIKRRGKTEYEDSTTVSRMKRSFTELAEYLFRELHFPHGCFLMTGTCLVPSPDFTLGENDVVEISIDGIGVLRNTVTFNPLKQMT